MNGKLVQAMPTFIFWVHYDTLKIVRNLISNLRSHVLVALHTTWSKFLYYLIQVDHYLAKNESFHMKTLFFNQNAQIVPSFILPNLSTKTNSMSFFVTSIS